MVVGGAVSGKLFRAAVGRHRAPARRPGDLAVMDNLPTHQVAGAAAAIERAGATRAYLPPIPPDRTPIERAFAGAEAEIRRQEPRAVAGAERRRVPRRVPHRRVPELRPPRRLRSATIRLKML